MDTVPHEDDKNPVIIPLAEKKQLLDEYNEIIWRTPRIQTSTIGYVDSHKRVIFLTVQDSGWKNATSVRKTVSGVGEILRNSVRVFNVDPGDAGEEPLLRTLKVDKGKNQSITYVISQSGQIGSRFEGPVSRKDLFMAFQKVLTARSGCGGSGSGPGGNTCK